MIALTGATPHADAHAPHPAEGLKDDLEALSITTAQAAQALGVTRQHLHRVINKQSYQ